MQFVISKCRNFYSHTELSTSKSEYKKEIPIHSLILCLKLIQGNWIGPWSRVEAPLDLVTKQAELLYSSLMLYLRGTRWIDNSGNSTLSIGNGNLCFGPRFIRLGFVKGWRGKPFLFRVELGNCYFWSKGH